MYSMNKEQIEEMYNIASITLAEHGSLGPMYFLLKDGSVVPIMRNTEDIRDVASIAVIAAQSIDADAIVLICEQWMLKMKKDDPNLQLYTDGILRPSDSDLKEAYLTLIHMTKDGEVDSLIGKINISPNGVKYVCETQWLETSVTNMITPWSEQ